MVPPVDSGSGFQSPFRVTLISAVALVGAAVGLLTCFWFMRAYQQARAPLARRRARYARPARHAAPRCTRPYLSLP